MNRIGDYAIGYQGSGDPFENYIDECPIATKREIWEQARQEAAREIWVNLFCYLPKTDERDMFADEIKAKFGLEG